MDFDYVVNSAKLLKEGNCKDFHLISTIGAKSSSWFLVWSTKGKAEDAIKSLGFEKTSIYRPGFLLAERDQPKMFGEMGQNIVRMVDKKNAKSIHVSDLAKVMVARSLQSRSGESVEILEHSMIVEMIPSK